jgi:hypothetical protein
MAETNSRALPNSPEAEMYLLSACFIDGNDVVGKCLEHGISADSFFDPRHGIIFQTLVALFHRRGPIDLAVVAEELKATKQLDEIGGYQFLISVSGQVATTAQAAYFIGKIRDLHLVRQTIREANRIIEQAHNLTGSVDDFLSVTKKSISQIGDFKSVAQAKPIFSFGVPQPGDSSILLGNRYLNRGDAGCLVSTAGMGKSSMTIQMAVHWALAMESFGIKPNGRLRSLIIQAEDSDGDIGEVVGSIRSRLELSDSQLAEINERVVIHTQKTRKNFLNQLRSLIEIHKPDIVWINPLQSFIEGDIKDSQDLGAFLRDGLGGLNLENKFAYMVVHHTTKPPQEKTDRQWNEVMYDMAGGAEIINWARCIMSLRASKDEGKFNLVLAKRGRRAGVTREVEQGAGKRTEIVTTIPLCHSHRSCVVNGITIPMIYWELDEPTPEKKSTENRKTTPLNFAEVKSAIPNGRDRSMNYAQIHRVLSGKKKVSQTVIADALLEWAKDGMIKSDNSDPNTPRYYL